jgi:hypothetical protein
MICVLWVINFAFAYDFLLHFGTIPAVWYLFYFHILLHHFVKNTYLTSFRANLFFRSFNS